MSVLPIEEIKSDFLKAINEQELVILSAPPGAGKSTGLPLWLVEQEQYGKIYLLQPRRMAAKSIANYLALQLGEPIGQRIGYRLRNETKVSSKTKIEVITEGILTQIIQHDPEISGSNLILFDEFHERSVHADFAFALAREVQTGLRDDLTIVLMSATLSVDFLKQKFIQASVLQCQGRSYPVDISYQPLRTTHASSNRSHFNAWRDHALTVIKTTVTRHQGSVLVFLPGSGDIHYLAQHLEGCLPSHFQLAPLFGDLTLAQQQQAIMAPQSGYKIVLATNIAETSLTIDGINLVIDCGLEKVAIFDNQTLTNKLNQQSIAKASATQRAGRAGRLMAGHCIRLYDQEEYARRSAHRISEIMQTDLQPILIEAARWGVSTLCELPMLELPIESLEQQAWQALQDLAIVDRQRKLTKHGEKVSAIPCHPRFAHMIITANDIEHNHQQSNFTLLACLIAAMLEERDVLQREQSEQQADMGFRVRYLLNNTRHSLHQRILTQAVVLAKAVLNKGAGASIKAQFVSSDFSIEHCGELLALAYPERISQQRNQQGAFLAVNGKGLQVHVNDALAASEFIAIATISQHRQQLKIRIAASVDINLLKSWNIATPVDNTVLAYDEQQDIIIAEHQLVLGAIVLERKKSSEQYNDQDIAQMWVTKLQQKGLSFLTFPASLENLLSRWRWLNRYQPHLGLPDVSEQHLVETCDVWLAPFVGKVLRKSQLKALDYHAMLLSLLSYQQQQQLVQCAPTEFTGPTGRQCSIRYQQEKSPIVSMPMQELYGQVETPTVGDKASQSSIPLTLELLSPAGRPIQVTQNLPAFWQGSYKEVQKEMKGRYPKHYWPDDPANAQPTNKTKRHLKL
ncbi:ATP-dependent helicase HrpB [Thalassotalea atypica]|uniref:ATP-dependent helicase HrpB n=1 Tax=Thalassotalea atypica TaxID=2054316 RepID=UPI002573ABB1|nr:ATP-dependent helicase HrpB [Thalassotalea atypica]